MACTVTRRRSSRWRSATSRWTGEPHTPTLATFQRTFDRFAGVPGVRLHNLTWRVLEAVLTAIRKGGGGLDGGSHRIEPTGAYRPDTQVLVRPDGYAGLIADAGDRSAIPEYLRSL